MKEKLLWSGIILILISWALNYAFFQSKQLAEPIFLDHYYIGYQDEMQSFTFYYLTNKQDPHEVTHVQIDGIDSVFVRNDDQGYGFWHDSSEITFDREYRHHYLKSVTLEFNQEDIPLNEPGSSFSFEKMEVFFTNQPSIVADVGMVSFYRAYDQETVFESRMSSGSNQHRSEEAMVSKEPVIIEDISVPFPEEIAEDIAVKVNFDQERLKELEVLKTSGSLPRWLEESRELEWEKTPGILIETEDVYPIKLNANEWLQLYMYFNPKRTSYFEFSVLIKGKSESGETIEYLSPMMDQPDLEQQDIDMIIAGKEGGK